MNRNFLQKSVLCLFCPLVASTAIASVEMDISYVGDIGNSDDTTGYGGVDYGYYVGTYEVTNSQYVSFLNAKAKTDTHTLYNSQMGTDLQGGITQVGSDGSFEYSSKENFGNKPVNFVSFWDAARFANWMTNGQGNGDSETGMYTLTTEDNTVTRNSTYFSAVTGVAVGAYAIASEDEWYKAAYYNTAGNYSSYPTGAEPSTEVANFSADGVLTDVGSFGEFSTSDYGTFDQGGNVFEWIDTIEGDNRVMRGGDASNTVASLESVARYSSDGGFEGSNVGFRVVPEPSSYAAIFGCFTLAVVTMRRKARRVF